MSTIATLLSGLGLFFIGVRALSANLVPLAGRRSMPVLTQGGIEKIRREGEVLSFERVLGETRLLCLFNLSAAPALFSTDEQVAMKLEPWGTAYIPRDGVASSIAA